MSPMVPFRMPLNENGLAKPSIKWRRVLLKVSGEALAGDQAQTIDPKVGKEKLPNFRVESSFGLHLFIFYISFLLERI